MLLQITAYVNLGGILPSLFPPKNDQVTKGEEEGEKLQYLRVCCVQKKIQDKERSTCILPLQRYLSSLVPQFAETAGMPVSFCP